MLTKSYDVVIAGGGTAGIIAAIASGRAGAKTALIEEKNYLGGTCTASFVGPWASFYAGDNKIVGGIPDELTSILKSIGGSTGHLLDSSGWATSVTSIDFEIYKLVAEEKVKEAGVDIYYNSSVCGLTQTASGVIDCVEVKSEEREAFEIHARVVVDATGDADIAYMAGADYWLGEDTGDGNIIQPVTPMFILGQVDKVRICEYMRSNPAEFSTILERDSITPENITVIHGYRGHFEREKEKRKAMGEDFPRKSIIAAFAMPQPDRMLINMIEIYDVDPLNPSSLNWAGREGVRLSYQLFDFLKTLPGFENSYIEQVSPYIGVRESRRIIGEYVLTIHDVAAQRRFEDVIARASYPVDLHGGTHEELPDIDINGCVDIPFRSLLPKNTVNLIMAGRSISATRSAFGCTRVQAPCMAVGQAAGEAAALAAQERREIRDIDIKMLQSRLTASGAILWD